MRQRAFTLVEIMIVILIVGVLMMMAVPQFLKARQQAQQRSCMSNLRQIGEAKEILSHETNLPNGAIIAPADIFPIYLKMPSYPACPGGGTYNLEPVGTDPTCSRVAPPYPHVLP